MLDNEELQNNIWFGVIEDNTPAKSGDFRYKVRIFNAHTKDLNEIPTQDLPWVIPLFSPNTMSFISVANEGDWVVGFFADWPSKQVPMMTGVIPRYVVQDPNELSGGFTANAKFESPHNTVTALNPVLPAGAPAMNTRGVGRTTLPTVSYQYNGTVIESSDNNRAHVCDITNEIRLSSAVEFIKNFSLFQVARAALESAEDAASASPIATQILNAIRTLRSYVKVIQYALKVVNKVINDIIRIIAFLRQMIAWILSLPTQLLKLLQQCLAELYAAISNAIGNTISDVSGSEIVTEIRGLYGDVLATTQTVIQTQAAAQAGIQASSKLLDPKTYGKP